MKTKTITLYSFSELSEQAQNRAAHKYQDVIQDIYEENANDILEQKATYWTKRTGIPIDKLTKKIYLIRAFIHKGMA